MVIAKKPTKKKAVKAVKAVKAKKPVGRPRKAIGTRVSDYDVLANVGSTKPMPRRIGRDALEQQRARLRYAVDYPGQRFTEQMTRALQDSFSTGMLPYGVSLRAPADFARKYPSRRLSGMPIGTDINVSQSAARDAEDALLEAAMKAAENEGAPPSKRKKVDRRARDNSEPYIPQTRAAEQQRQSEENLLAMQERLIAERRAELEAVKSSGVERAARSALSSSSSSSSSRAPASSRSDPGRLSDDQISALRSAMSLLNKQVEAKAPAKRNVRSAQLARLAALEAQNRDAAVALARPQPPATRLVLSDVDRRRIERLQERIATANHILSQPMPSSRAGGYDVLREEMRRDEAEIRDILEANTVPAPPSVTSSSAPPAQQVVVSVPDAAEISQELKDLLLEEAKLSATLDLQRAGKSNAATKRTLENVRERLQAIQRETAAVTPSTMPPVPEVPQTIVVPGTEQRSSASTRAIQELAAENDMLRQQQDQMLRGSRAREEELAYKEWRADIDRRKAAAPSEPELRASAPTAVGVTPAELEAIQTFVTATIGSNKGYKQGMIDELMKKNKPIDPEKRNALFQRQADAVNRANAQVADRTKTPAELRKTAALQIMPQSARERLLAEADRRDGDRPGVLREPSAQNVPTITPAQLAMISQAVETDRAPAAPPAATAVIPPASDPPAPQSQDGPATGSVNGTGLQHVTAATFPSGKWTTASSLRWLRSNGLHPIRKSTKINGSYSYALQSPVGYSSFNSVKMSYKNKDFTIVYGTPK